MMIKDGSDPQANSRNPSVPNRSQVDRHRSRGEEEQTARHIKKQEQAVNNSLILYLFLFPLQQPSLSAVLRLSLFLFPLPLTPQLHLTRLLWLPATESRNVRRVNKQLIERRTNTSLSRSSPYPLVLVPPIIHTRAESRSDSAAV